MQVKSQTNKPKKVIPVGSYAARLYSIVDLGTQNETYKGEPITPRKVRFTFEFPDVKEEYDGVEKPSVLWFDLTLSFGDKAKLMQILGTWLNKNKEQLQNFELKDLIGKTAYIGVMEYTKKDETTGSKVNVNSITPLPKGLKVEEQFNDSQFFSIDEFDQATFDKLPKFLKDKIELSPEYVALRGWATTSLIDDEDDSLPF